MQRSQRHGPPRHLEKMLFINHKEDLLLGDRLSQLTLRSRQRSMELDLERIKVRNEWRHSRKKNMTVSEAIAAGILPPPEPTAAPGVWQRPPAGNSQPSFSRQGSLHERRPAASAPPRKKLASSDSKISRAKTFFKEPRGGRESMLGSFPKHPTIPESEEHVGAVVAAVPGNRFHRRVTVDTVGTYVLDEFEKVSQVVPDILRALAKKKEQFEEEAKNAQIAFDLQRAEKVDLMDYEPDMNKVRKTVGSVKKLRHRMAISKKLEVNKPKKSFDQMVKDRTDSAGEYDEYTDGICVLMKRKLDKKRKNSSEHDSLGRRHSLPVPSLSALPRRTSSLPVLLDGASRRSSSFPLSGGLSKSSTSLGFGSSFKLGSSAGQEDTGAALIDEDELVNRQRILRELGRYEMLQDKVIDFLLRRRPGSRQLQAAVNS